MMGHPHPEPTTGPFVRLRASPFPFPNSQPRMTVQPFTFNPFQTNSYVVHQGGEGVIVDASCIAQAECQQVIEYVEQESLTIRHLLLTHAHIDHIFGCAPLAEHFGMGWLIHRADEPFIRRAMDQAVAFGVALEEPPAPEGYLEAGDTVAVGEAVWHVLHTPGHSPGSICFHDPEADIVLSGDVLFQGSIGRTQGLPQTSLPQLMDSIFQQLLPLGDATAVYPGHGPATTIGRERKTNPFLTEGFGQL